jgi:hypothetical protein
MASYINTDCNKFLSYLKPNFFCRVNIIPQIIDKFKTSDEVSITTIGLYLEIGKKCKGEVSSMKLSDLCNAAFQRIKAHIDALEPSALPTIDENQLSKMLSFIRESVKSGPIDAFEKELAFRLVPFPGQAVRRPGSPQRQQDIFGVPRRIDQGTECHRTYSDELHKEFVGLFAVFLPKFCAAGSSSQDVLSRLWQLSLAALDSPIVTHILLESRTETVSEDKSKTSGKGR